jgi:hypothetical protein
LQHYAREVDAYGTGEDFAYPLASALLDLALAFASHDTKEASARVNAGLALAVKYGFHELDFQFRDLAKALVAGPSSVDHAAPVRVAPRGETVLRDMIGEADARGLERRTNRRMAAASVR